MTDNKQLVRQIVLPDIEQVNSATTAEITEVKKILEKYDQLLSRIIRDRLSS